MKTELKVRTIKVKVPMAENKADYTQMKTTIQIIQSTLPKSEKW